MLPAGDDDAASCSNVGSLGCPQGENDRSAISPPPAAQRIEPERLTPRPAVILLPGASDDASGGPSNENAAGTPNPPHHRVAYSQAPPTRRPSLLLNHTPSRLLRRVVEKV